jgi:hypothetical protein
MSLSPTDAKAIVTAMRTIDEKMNDIIQEQVKIRSILCAQVDSVVDKTRDDMHREAMGTIPLRSKKPERIVA